MPDPDAASPSWPLAPRPSVESVDRRQAVLEAAALGDHVPAATALTDADDRVRATALLALHQLDALHHDHVVQASEDSSTRVRRQLAGVGAADHRVDLAALIGDRESTVCETACWAAGERSGGTADELVALLASTACDHDDPLCRESAVAALGSIGAAEGLQAILAATTDRATVRRRAVLALAPFDTPEVTAALKRALEDRDWQVRQAAEDLGGPTCATESP